MTWSILARDQDGTLGNAGSTPRRGRVGLKRWSEHRPLPTAAATILARRVDDHEARLDEPQRLDRKSLERFRWFVACLPRRDDRIGLADRRSIEAKIAQLRAAVPPAGMRDAGGDEAVCNPGP